MSEDEKKIEEKLEEIQNQEVKINFEIKPYDREIPERINKYNYSDWNRSWDNYDERR
jgi:hypothetical protein